MGQEASDQSAGSVSSRSGEYLRAIAYTAVAMVFFAANSVLARLAMREREIDGGSFTSVRIISGALVLASLVALGKDRSSAWRQGSWKAGVALFAYAISFSYAYLSLSAGMGALILFAAVQITMIGVSILRGLRPETLEWFGLSLALAGFVYLVSPGLTAPSLKGAVLMACAGVSWGGYSLAAKGVRFPTAATAGNFMRAAPMAVLLMPLVWAFGEPHWSPMGMGLAFVSGALTSGLGYAIWYAALKELTPSRAAIVQLTVPVIAAIAGVLLLGERMTLRIVLASAAILGGVALALARRQRTAVSPRLRG